MAKTHKFYSDIDLRKNELQNHTIHFLANFPANAREGQFIYHSTLKAICVCINDTIDTTLPIAWKIFTSSAESNDIPNITCTIDEEVLDAVYLIGDSEVRAAKANDIATSNIIGFIQSKSDDTTCVVRTRGLLTGFNGSGLDINKTYFLSKNYDGGITDVPPTGYGEVLVRVGVGFSNDTLLIDIDRTLVIRS